MRLKEDENEMTYDMRPRSPCPALLFSRVLQSSGLCSIWIGAQLWRFFQDTFTTFLMCIFLLFSLGMGWELLGVNFFGAGYIE